MAETHIDENGYRRFVDSNKLVSRWIAEKQLGRKLRYEEIVHHRNRNKLDNKPNNLFVFENQDEHHAHHEAAGDFDADYEDFFAEIDDIFDDDDIDIF